MSDVRLDALIDQLKNQLDRVKYHDEKFIMSDYIKTLIEQIDDINEAMHDDCHDLSDVNETKEEYREEGFEKAKKLIIRKVLEQPDYKKRGEMISAVEALEYAIDG